ncbi:MAG: GC-type dockerin domain-anchored protein [Phycisphaerales bacterium]|nr:GC-type dockerin domain-anchored protein [Phycisphaerales bacterium]
MRWTSLVVQVGAAVVFSAAAFAQSPVEHTPGAVLPSSDLSPANPFGGATTQRSPAVPREDEPVGIYFQVCCQFTYDRASVYYTVDGTEPQGASGIGIGSTLVLSSNTGGVSFVANHFNQAGGTRDWWLATLPATTRTYGQTVKYKLSKWSAGNPSSEVFSGGATNSATATSFAYTNKLAWPGAGSGNPNPGAGYPQVHFWKEEAVTGNGFINLQLDQNGSYYDVYFPGAGAVWGVGTKNEGYAEGPDTFPAGLPQDNRGQMHINQAMAGVRIAGTTYWLSNTSGGDYTNVAQSYESDSNTVRTSQRLTAGGSDISVQQLDFAPRGVTLPTGGAGDPLRAALVKRMILRNNGASTVSANVYFYADAALNGGDAYDGSFVDAARGAMVHYDNTLRTVSNTGPIGPGQEYNPATDPSYTKNVSVYLAFALKSGGSLSSDSWQDTSSDQGRGWIGKKVTLPPGVEVKVDCLTAGGFDNFAGATGTYAAQIAPLIDWFAAGDMDAAQSQTDTSWRTWLGAGVTVDTPDDAIDALFRRGLLATALHLDGRSGAMIAGFHNGAYPFVWPRDAVYGAVTLARAGHTPEAGAVYGWMKNTAYRDFESWPTGARKGFWKQKYTTDGYVVWGAPQVDETAVFPWGVYFQYRATGEPSVLADYVEQVRDAVRSCTQTSTIDPGRLHTAFGLMYSNNVWEDSYDTFVYSNASIVRGLRDAAAFFDALGLTADRDDALGRAASFKSALDARLDWDGENTDISALGLCYPFAVYSPIDARATRVLDRINGTRTKFNNTAATPEPLVNTGGQFDGLVNRYWGDGYWNGGPWFLTTLWYGAFHAQRQDFTAGKADIDNHLYRLTRTAAFNGPMGLGAEQMAPANSMLYPDGFRLQAAWPNAWESMSTYVDAVMLFAGYEPDAPGDTLRVSPKLPTGWGTVSFANLAVGGKAFDMAAVEKPAQGWNGVTFTARQSAGSSFEAFVRIPAGMGPCQVLINGVEAPQSQASADAAIGRVRVTGAIAGGVGTATEVRVYTRSPADIGVQGGLPGSDGLLDNNDFVVFIDAFFSQNADRADIGRQGGVFGSDGAFDNNDFVVFIDRFFAGCR